MVWDTEEEFRNLYETHQEQLLRYLIKLSGDRDIAEDLTQEVFIKIHKARDSYDPEKGAFLTWAYRIAHNTFLNHIKKHEKSKKDRNFDDVLEQTVPGGSDPGYEIEQKILINEIKKAILSLPEPERSVLYNKEIKHKTLAQTAEELDLTVRTISRKLLRAYDMVREELKKKQIMLD